MVEKITFRLPKADDYNYWNGRLSLLISTEQAQAVGNYTLARLEGVSYEILDEEGNNHRDIINAIHESNCERNTVVRFMAMVIATNDNIKTYLSLISKEATNLIHRVVKQYYLSTDDAEQLTTPPVFKNQLLNNYGLGDCSWMLCSGFPAFKNVGKDSGLRNYLHFYPSLYAQILPALYPDAEKPVVAMDQLPEDEFLKTESFEEKIAIDLNVVRGNYLDETFTVRPSKLISTRVSKSLDALKIQEFQLAPVNETTAHLRAHFIVAGVAMMMLCYPQIMKADNIRHEDFIKAMVDKLQYHRELTFDMFLPYISGVRKNDLDSCTADRLITRIRQNIRQAGDGWIRVEDIDLQLYRSINDYRIPLTLINPPAISGRHYIFNSFTGMAMNADRMVRQMGIAFAHSFLYYLASLGCIEAAFSDTNQKAESPYEAMRYFRLTPLGRYVLGIDESYTPPKVELDKEYFEIDDKRLIIRSIAKDNPYVNLVADIANPLFGNRYEVTAQSFLQHCNTEKDIDYRISVFQQYVTPELPEIWKEFFSQIRQRCRPLKLVPQNRFRIYHIDPENTTLIRLLTTDPRLHSCIIRCEDYYIMVKTDFQNEFENRMAELGYLL